MRAAATVLASSLQATVSTSTNAASGTTRSSRKRIRSETETKVLSSASGPEEPLRVKRKKKVIPLEDYPKRSVSEWKVGAHVSAAGGVENAILNAASIGYVCSLSEIWTIISERKCFL